MIPKPNKGDSLDATIYNSAWVGSLVDAANGAFRQTNVPLAPVEAGLELITTQLDAVEVVIEADGLIGAYGYDNPETTFATPPRMKATLGRSLHLYYTKVKTFGDGYIHGYVIPSDRPIRLRAKDPATMVGYQRKFVAGLPCGRELNGSEVVAGEGGLILLSKPFRDPAEITGNYMAWVIADTVKIWDAFIIKATTDSGAVAPTNILTGRGKYVAGFLRADPTVLAVDQLKDVVTDVRFDVRPRDPSETYDDGTYIQVMYRNNEWKVVWSSCGPVSGLTGKLKEPV